MSDQASNWISGDVGVGTFDGSLHEVTRKASKPGEWDEGWATARSADGAHVLIQLCDRDGVVVRIAITAEQAWRLFKRIENESIALKTESFIDRAIASRNETH